MKTKNGQQSEREYFHMIETFVGVVKSVSRITKRPLAEADLQILTSQRLFVASIFDDLARVSVDGWKLSSISRALGPFVTF